MIVSDTSGTLTYEWVEDWARTPGTESTQANGRTHGVAEARTGDVYIFHQAVPAVLVYDRNGALLRSFGNDFPGAHGLTMVEEGGAEYLWLTDEGSGLVAKLTLDGEIVQTVAKPDHPAYAESRYSPTWAAVNAVNGDIWVTDGYGAGLIHRYTPEGDYVATIDGTEYGAAGRFSCPHSVWFDTRGGKDAELYVADRGNKRVQVYDGAGVFKRAFGSDFFVHPCAFAAAGDLLYVPELFGRIAVLDRDDNLIGYVGSDADIVGDGGWPRLPDYPNLPRERVQPGKFIAPHGVGTGKDGSVYIVEWYYPGGRITRLNPR